MINRFHRREREFLVTPSKVGVRKGSCNRVENHLSRIIETLEVKDGHGGVGDYLDLFSTNLLQSFNTKLETRTSYRVRRNNQEKQSTRLKESPTKTSGVVLLKGFNTKIGKLSG